MSDSILYRYPSPSALVKAASSEELFLARYSEIEKKEAPCFFYGRLSEPFITARCLVTLANVVQSSFSLSPADMPNLKTRS